MRVFSQGATVLVGIVLFFHGVEGLLDLIAPKDAPSRFLFGLALFAGSLLSLVVNRGFVAASGIEADDDAADAVAPAGLVTRSASEPHPLLLPRGLSRRLGRGDGERRVALLRVGGPEPRPGQRAVPLMEHASAGLLKPSCA